MEVNLEVASEVDDEEEEHFHPLNVALEATPHCPCDQFGKSGDRCAHSLAVAWWLQEQLSRRSINEVFEFFGELEVDAVSAGRDLVSQVLSLVGSKSHPDSQSVGTRLQWRVGLSSSRYYRPLPSLPMSSGPKKMEKGGPRERKLGVFDLLRRDFSSRKVDGRIAALVANPSYSFNEDHFAEFQACPYLRGIRMLLGMM